MIAFVEDVAASAGYWLASSADEIHADPSSVVGSIGVISGGFGFPELLKKIGIERRVYTSGENKSVLDPFQPEKQSDIDHLDWMSAETKVKAHAKLAAFRPKIGYPSQWHDYSALKIDKRDAFGNEWRANEWARHDNIAHLGKPLRGAPAVIGVPTCQQRLHYRPIGLQSLGLPVRRERPADVRPLVPVQTKPAQRVVDLLLAAGVEAGPVGVLDAQHERPALLARERQVEQRHVRRADVRIAGRRRRDAKPDRHRAPTRLRRTPMPSISTSTVSPTSIGPIPSGVPVRMTSPGSSVMQEVM